MPPTCDPGPPSPPSFTPSQLTSRFSLPFLATSMGRGVVPDDSPLCANAARSLALSRADVALVVGARYVWAMAMLCAAAGQWCVADLSLGLGLLLIVLFFQRSTWTLLRPGCAG